LLFFPASAGKALISGEAIGEYVQGEDERLSAGNPSTITPRSVARGGTCEICGIVDICILCRPVDNLPTAMIACLGNEYEGAQA
jgi:hypothetical protein